LICPPSPAVWPAHPGRLGQHPASATRQENGKGHGDLERWQSALDALPKIQPSEVDLLNGLTSTPIATTPPARRCAGADGPVAVAQGPFDLFGVHVDTEWRSDWKWSRVARTWT
jgi:hypothetical protein